MPIMDSSANNDVDTTPAELAARAEEAARALYLRTSGTVDATEGLASPGEMHEVLGSLKLVVENLTRCLPELGTWLEQRMWSGRLGNPEGSYDALTESIFEVASALARAHRMSSALGRELQAAQTASGELAKL